MKKARKKGPPSRLLMPKTVGRHRRSGSDPSSLSDSVLSSELDGKFPRPLGTPQTLETLQLPEIIELIEVPETPETAEFEVLEMPGSLERPEILEVPEVPEVLEMSDMAELLEPELPDTPNTPEMPDTPPSLPPPIPPPLPLHRLPGTPPPPPPPLAPMLSAVLVLSRGLGERLGEDCGKSEIRKSVKVLEEVKSNLEKDDEGSAVAPKEEVVAQKEEVVDQKEEEVAKKEEQVTQKEEEVAQIEEVVAQKEEQVTQKEEVVAQKEEVVDQKEEEMVAQKKEVVTKQEEVDVEQEKEVVVEQEKEVAVEQEKEVVVKQGKEVTVEQRKEVVVKQEKEVTFERATIKWERPKVRAKKERQKKEPGKLRYFEGIPLQEGENKKELTGWSRWEEREKSVPVVVPEGVQEKCLQCRVRKLRCTLTKKLVAPKGDGVWREGPCWRCVQHGDGHECLIKPGPAGWEFAEKDFTVLPYDPTADFYVRVTKEREIELVNFREEGRQREILEKWTERDEKVVVDTIANCTGKVKISAFAPPRPRNRKELEPFSYGEGATIILRRSV